MSQSQKPRILIVEDDKKTADRYERALNRIGDSRIAEYAEQVFSGIIDFDPQVILLDIVLEGERAHGPWEAGVRILEDIRELHPPLRELTVVVVTGRIDSEIETQCWELGVAAFLRKPVSVKDLRQAVEEALKEQCFKVFISSTIQDMEAERWIVRQAIEELGPRYNPEMIDDFRTRPGSLRGNRRKAARECDLFILLLGEKYGAPSVPSPIEDEYNVAWKAGKPILVFVKDVPTREPLLRAFLTRLRDPNTGPLAKDFHTDDQLRVEVKMAVTKICRRLDPAKRTVLEKLGGEEKPIDDQERVSVHQPLQRLAQLMQMRREHKEPPYVLLLGSSLSLTPDVRRAFTEMEDWEAFWREMQRAAPAERRVLLKKPLDALGLDPGYQAVAQLAEAGYFDLILTLNVDDAIDNVVRPLSADQSVLLIYDGSNAVQIVEVLSHPTPRIKVVKLRGDINARKLPLTPESQFEFPPKLEDAVTQWLSRDTVVVGDLPFDDDVQRCLRRGENALWCILPDEPASDSFIMRAKQSRPFGEIITGARFNAFFTALAECLRA